MCKYGLLTFKFQMLNWKLAKIDSFTEKRWLCWTQVPRKYMTFNANKYLTHRLWSPLSNIVWSLRSHISRYLKIYFYFLEDNLRFTASQWKHCLDWLVSWRWIQYIPRNMYTVFALLCFVVVIHWLIFPYPSGLLHWHCGNLTIAPVPAKQPW